MKNQWFQRSRKLPSARRQKVVVCVVNFPQRKLVAASKAVPLLT